MVRSIPRLLTLAVLALAALFAAAPDARAGTTIRGTIAGQEVLPEVAQHLRRLAGLRQRAAAAYERARRVGDRRTMAEARQAAQEMDRLGRELQAMLRTATTVVTVYGDAGTRVTRAQIIALLRGGNRWQHAQVHIWQRNGRLAWDVRAPRGGFDDRRGTPASGNRRPYGQTVDVGGMRVAPLAIPVPTTKPAPSRTPAPRRGGRGGKNDPTAGTLYGF